MISSEQQGIPHGIEGENPESLTLMLPVLRQQMVRFATLQLGRKDEAEDVVQEALLGALCGQERFAGRAALRSWVFGILKHKIADLLRQQRRWQPLQAQAEDELADHAVLDQLFSERHHWHMSQRPTVWRQPDQAAEDHHFWRVFDLCLKALPPAQGRVFMMREFIELESQEICAATGLSISNLNVLLYRARLRLRHCLEANWFEEASC